MKRLQIVWFKRDLRVFDHAPLAAAAERGPVLPLYIVEPVLWAQPDAAGRHWAFISESLAALDRDLAALGQPLVVRTGEATKVLERLLGEHPIETVWSHEETGNGWTYARDRAVGRLLRRLDVPWYEVPSNGVVRRLPDRNRWSRIWESRMRGPLIPPPALAPVAIERNRLPSSTELGARPDECPDRQLGGRQAGESLLNEFLTERGETYHRSMSSPVTAYDHCSRLSAHLAYGTLSLREVLKATRLRIDQVRALESAERGEWLRALTAFEGRLHWHCHFIQKLEDAPDIEHRNLHRVCDGLREDAFDRERFEAWCDGRTGFPLVDACQRALRDTGWINFRMRAMLVSFSAYHLWLHWREPALHLARRFTDYEPGIHYSQMQMQSGTTGINTLRIYNPVKQSEDQDPDGQFIRHWVSELSSVPSAWIHTPWRMPEAVQKAAGCHIGRDYPEPIVDHLAAARAARARFAAIRRGSESRRQSREIVERHGSRKRSGRGRAGGAR